MAIGQETEGRGIGGFMNRFQRQWDAQRAIDAQEEMRRRREMQAEEAKRRESDGGGQDNKRDSRPASQSGLNTPSSSIGSPTSGAATLPARTAPVAGVGGSTGPAGGFNSTHTLLMNELTSRGVKPEVAAGAIGSMMGESGRGLNPGAYNPNDVNGPSGGLAQWHDPGRPDRFTGLLNFAGVSRDQAVRNGQLVIPADVQAKYLGHELDTRENGVLRELQRANTVSDGNRIWTYDFERPREKAQQTAVREHHGRSFWDFWSSNGGATPAASTSPAAPRNIDAGTPTNRASTDGRYRVAADTTTMTDASPSRSQQIGGAVTTPGGATPSATTPTTTGAAPNPGVDAPLPPRRPADLGGDVPLPPRRPEELSPPPQQAQPQQSGDAGKGIGGFLDSLFGPPPKDEYGREWDPLYGFEKPQESRARNDNAGSMLDLSSLETSAKSIFSPTESASSSASAGASAGGDFSPAFNFFSSLFG